MLTVSAECPTGQWQSQVGSSVKGSLKSSLRAPPSTGRQRGLAQAGPTKNSRVYWGAGPRGQWLASGQRSGAGSSQGLQVKRVRIWPRIGPGTESQPLSTCGSEEITKQAGTGDWNLGKGAVRPRQARPLEAAGATARPLPPASEGAGAWSQRRGPCCRPLPNNRRFWPACLASSVIYISGVLAVIKRLGMNAFGGL